MMTNSFYIDILIYLLIPLVFCVALFFPYPNFSSKKRNKKDEHN